MPVWYFVRGGHREGPVSAEFVADELRGGRLGPEDLAWTESMEAWQPIGELPDLLELAARTPPPLPSQVDEDAPLDPAVATPETVPAPVPLYADLRLRIAAAVLDQILLVVPGFVLALGVIGVLVASDADFDLATDAGRERLQQWLSLIGIIANWLYCAGFEASAYQATPGMMALGLRVGDRNGLRLGFSRASLRHFLRGVTWLFAWFPAFILPTRQTLYDIVTEAFVLRRPPSS